MKTADRLVATGADRFRDPDSLERLVEVIELPDHPFFVASQFHPEFKSRPERPAPLFREFVLAALERTSAREPHPIEQLRAASH